jgi:hypothetical protein
MIAIVRMKARETRETLWDYVVTHVAELQNRLGQDGRLLYLSQRAKHDDVSLFVHTAHPDALAALIANDLSRMEGVTDIWVINLLKPVFFPLPEDTRAMRRYAITARVFPAHLVGVYESLSRPALPAGLLMAYVAYTFHLFGDCLQFSVLAQDEAALEGHLAEKVKTLPGVLQTTVNLIEKTKPLVSHEEWREYSRRHSLVPSWNERDMIKQFAS